MLFRRLYYGVFNEWYVVLRIMGNIEKNKSIFFVFREVKIELGRDDYMRNNRR